MSAGLTKVHGSMRPGDDVLCRCGHIRGYHSFGALGCMADPDCECKGFKDPCVCAIAWASPTPRPICPAHSSLSRVVAHVVESQILAGDVVTFKGVDSPVTFQPPICFVPRADFEGLPAKWPSDTAWKASQFPTPEVM